MDLSHAHHFRYSSCVIWKDPPSPNPAGVAETGWRTALSSIHCCEAKSAAAASAAFEKMTLKFTRRFPCWTSALLPVCPSHQFILGDSPRLTDTRHLHPGNWVKKWAVQDFLFFFFFLRNICLYFTSTPSFPPQTSEWVGHNSSVYQPPLIPAHSIQQRLCPDRTDALQQQQQQRREGIQDSKQGKTINKKQLKTRRKDFCTAKRSPGHPVSADMLPKRVR